MNLQQRIEEDENYLDPALWKHDAANAPDPEHYEPNDEDAITAADIASYVPLTPEERAEAQMAGDDVLEYESLTGHRDRVQDVIRSMERAGSDPMSYYHQPDKASGKLFDFKPMVPGIRTDYEYLVEGLLRAGTNVLSGPRGAGKTSVLAPLVCAIAGLIPRYPMDIKLRRRVILFTEDRAQITRLFDSMIDDGYMNVTHEELNRWVHLSDAERITTEAVTEHEDELSKMWTPNQRVDGGIYDACPLLVFDTISAGIEMDSISDNDDVGKEIAKMRSALDGKASLLLVGHTAKDGGKQFQTMLGAQAWEANTIGSITLKVNGDKRHIEITKDRFAAPVKLFDVSPIRTSCSGVDVLGNPTTIHDLYSELVPMTKEQAEEVQVVTGDLRKDVLAYIGQQPGQSGSAIRDGVGKNKKEVGEVITALAKSSQIRNVGTGNRPKWAVNKKVADDLPPELN